MFIAEICGRVVVWEIGKGLGMMIIYGRDGFGELLKF